MIYKGKGADLWMELSRKSFIIFLPTPTPKKLCSLPLPALHRSPRRNSQCLLNKQVEIFRAKHEMLM